MRFANRAICAGGLGFAVAVLVGCGGSGSLLSSGQAGELNNQLAAVSRALSARQCRQAASELSTFQSTVNNLGSVNQTLVSNLNQGASTISTLAARQCPTGISQTTTSTTTAKTTTSSTTTSSSTTTTPTTTTPTTTTPTTTTATTTTTTTGPGSGGVAPGLGGNNGVGNGGGQGDGNGNGGGAADTPGP